MGGPVGPEDKPVDIWKTELKGPMGSIEDHRAMKDTWTVQGQHWGSKVKDRRPTDWTPVSPPLSETNRL